MKKALLTLLYAVLAIGIVHADFTDDPPEPGVSYRLRLLCEPEGSATLYGGGNHEAGDRVDISCSPYEGYEFVCWTLDGDTVSTSRYYTVTMPRKSLTYTAHLKAAGANSDFDPQDPPEPPAPPTPVQLYTLTVLTEPDDCGTTNYGTSIKLEEGQNITLRANPDNGYVVDGWYYHGKLMSIQDQYAYTMQAQNDTITLRFVYFPEDPQEPGQDLREYTLITSQSQLEQYRNYTEFNRSVWLRGPNVTSLKPLAALKKINGYLRIDNTSIPNLEDLSSLESIQDKLVIVDNRLIASLDGLDDWSGINYVYIESNRNLLDFCAMAEYAKGTSDDKGVIRNNGYNPTFQDIASGNCSLNCAAPIIKFDGRYAAIESFEDYQVRYTLDGSMPSHESALYLAPFDTEGIATITAIATKVDFYDSEAVTLRTPVYFDGSTATIESAGHLGEAFGWTDANEVDSIGVEGNIDAADLATLRSMQGLRVLDMRKTAIKSLPARALQDSRLLWVVLPESLEAIGDNVFDGCGNLAAVAWTSAVPMSPQAMNGLDGHGNLLLYTTADYPDDNAAFNVVKEGRIDLLRLADGEGNFFAPYPFVAGRAEYVRTFGKTTPIGGCAGWETLALPFDADGYEHADRGEIVPFAQIDDNGPQRPFWLYSLTDNGWTGVAEIRAYEPYLIAMPNNPAYSDGYNLAGDVTFFARNEVEIPATQTKAATKGEYQLVPTTVCVERGVRVAPIDELGEAFVPDLRDAQPFEAYLTVAAGQMRAPIRVADIGMGATNALPAALQSDNQWRVYIQDGTIYICTSMEQTVTIYNVAGVAQRVAKLHQGVNAIDGLAPGVYFVKGAKVMIRQ